MKWMLIAACFVPGCVFAALQTEEETVFYPVVAQSTHDLLAAVNAASPIRENGETYHAYTQYNIHWRFRWQRRSERCKLTIVQTHLALTYTYPRLQSQSSAVDAVWQSWMPRLVAHENGHSDIAKEYARRIDKMLVSLDAFDSCNTLEQQANQRAHRLMDELNTKTRRYDQQTNHGETQQAWLYQHL